MKLKCKLSCTYFTHVSMFNNKDKFWPIDIVKLKLVEKHTLRSLFILVKQDSCRLNNTESLLSVLLLLGK